MSEKLKGEKRCPICGKPVSADYRPFCSKRCADIDLGRWLGGQYVIPGSPDSEEDGGEVGTDASAQPSRPDKGS